ncbi:unnamed protein product [Didymodactylos carnosus]|uniref:RRM domain-containing protein n=1 Tax=Didymodactylos carnosus TaxID=1234261 RepID=A0A814TJA7_9BILA|nr:unnamed protein product [Didymodactylos carnosus]CAF1161598.1 unnamed protein product [Didymodactylos carnosus]CAF3733724.1 unnamed protein product [Didymodactylos carnosus]CAF3925270.1 unnamed protein product [Didymodactylos carnosus]
MATEHDDDIDKMLEEYESEHRNQSPATALVPPLKAAPLDKINTNNRSPTPQSKDRKYHSPSPVKESKYRSSDHENGKEKDRSSKKHRKERKHSHRHKERKEHKDSKRLSRSRSRKRSRSSPKEKKMKRERDDEKELSIHRRRSVTPINERKYRSPSPPRKTKMDIPNSTRRSRSRDLNNDLNLISKSSGNNPGPRSRSKDNDSRSHTSRTRDKSPELSPEERDMRTVFCMQLAARIRPRDLEEFFSQVGKARDVRLITDPRTRRSKGVAYVEFRDLDCVTQAIALSGQKVLGVPIIIKPSNAEKNRLANQNASANNGNSQFSFQQSSVPQTGPMKLYVGSLHFNITEDMLRGIFEPFGRIESINLMKDTETSRSRGYAFIQFAHAEDAKRAMENLNGFELAGRPMKVGHVTERVNDGGLASNLDSEELDQRGINLGATGRLALMAKLADGSGLQMPQYALNALNMAQQGRC